MSTKVDPKWLNLHVDHCYVTNTLTKTHITEICALLYLRIYHCQYIIPLSKNLSGKRTLFAKREFSFPDGNVITYKKVHNLPKINRKALMFDISKFLSRATIEARMLVFKMVEEIHKNNENVQNRLGICEVCGAEDAQYVCPRCELKTCSVNCVKIHKKELECNGERDKTSFIPLSKFSNLTLLSDYRFLEDVSRTIDNCRRNPFKKYTRYKRQLPPHLYKLRKEALGRKTTIQYLPQHFTRHKENTTFLHFDTKIIYWKLELIFPQANNIKIIVDKCDENERLSAVLSRFVDYDSCPDLYRKSLQFYHSVGTPGLEVLLKAENVQVQPSYFVLDMSLTLRENFEERIIIEYPILLVILKNYKDEYEILDPDMQVDTNARTDLRKKFSEYIPFTYFDPVTYKSFKNDETKNSINSSAAELRKYFSGGVSDEEMEETAEIEVQQKNILKSNKLKIPTYENLIKQNS